MMFFNWFVHDDQQPHWVSASKSKPVLTYLGNKLEAALPPDLAETIIAKIRKKGGDTSAHRRSLTRIQVAEPCSTPISAPVPTSPGSKRRSIS